MTSVQSSLDIGVLKRLRVLCISETGWLDTAAVFDDIRAAGGFDSDQYRIPWPPFGDLHAENARGFSALLEAETEDGAQHRILFDTGWNPAWMDRRFSEEGVDKLLQDGQIEALVISHEHFDHFWGIGSTLKHCPDITLYVPQSMQPQGLAFIKEQGHSGKLIKVPSAQPMILLPGLAVASLPTNALLRVSSENALYAHIQDRGMAMMTGCGHGGVLSLLDYARQTFQGGDRIFGLYGGLHIAPLEDWDESREQTVKSLAQYGIAKLACNHCTGHLAVEKMLETGLPVVRGTARNGSQTELFVGNGDVVEFG